MRALPQTRTAQVAATVTGCLFITFVLAVLFNLVGVTASLGILLTFALCVYLFDL